MKRVYSLAIVLILFGINAYSLGYLNVKGTIKQNREAIDSIKITIIKNGKPDTVFTTNDKGKFEVCLKQNFDYNVIVSKDGCFSQNILFDTHINSNENYRWNYKFAMNILPNISNKPEDYFLEPIALISYNEQTDEFENNYYSDDKVMFSEGVAIFENLMTQNYNQTINKADSAFQLQNFKFAKQLYKKAAILDESKEYADLQIDLIKKIELQERQSQNKCKKIIETADKYFNNNELAKAKKLYAKATKLNNCEYAKKQLSKIEAMVTTEDIISAR